MALPARKTTDSNMSWSPERRAAWSKRMKKEKANGTWHKKTKEEIGRNISSGKKASNKKKRLSIARKNGWETRRANGNKPKVVIPEVETHFSDPSAELKLLLECREILAEEYYHRVDCGVREPNWEYLVKLDSKIITLFCKAQLDNQ